MDVAALGGLALPGRRAAEYDVVAIPGGRGCEEELYQDPDLGRLLVKADAAGRIIAAVGDGAAALLRARTPDGCWPFADRRMTGSSELAPRLRALGAYYESGPESRAYVVRDGNLITGRNVASAGPLSEVVLEALGVSVSG